MGFLVIFASAIAALVAAVVGLAYLWSFTPHGRLHPFFAFGFRLQQVLGGAADGVLSEPMSTPGERAQARAAFLRGTAALARRQRFVGEIEERSIDGAGGALRVVVYRPGGQGPFPLLLYFHGGGFVVGSPAYTEGVTSGVATQAPAVVVSVDYRLAPESPWPAAVEDATCALEWCCAHAHELGVDPGRIAVGGDSAGGNLAAVLARRDRDAGLGRIALQLLIYPSLDATRIDRASHRCFASGYGLSRNDVAACLGHYIPPGADPREPDISPLHASSLAGLPPALVFTAGFDVLRDEGLEYVDRLRKAGVSTEHVHQPRLPHGYLTVTAFCREAAQDITRIAATMAAL